MLQLLTHGFRRSPASKMSSEARRSRLYRAKPSLSSLLLRALVNLLLRLRSTSQLRDSVSLTTSLSFRVAERIFTWSSAARLYSVGNVGSQFTFRWIVSVDEVAKTSVQTEVKSFGRSSYLYDACRRVKLPARASKFQLRLSYQRANGSP